MPTKKEKPLEQLAHRFAMLGHPRKLEILLHMLHGKQTLTTTIPTIIAHQLNMPVAVTSYSLKRMSSVGILSRVCHGRHTYYSVNSEFIAELKETFNYEGS